MELDAKLRLVAEHAPKLRAAGVHQLVVGDITMVLTPAEPTAPPAPVEDETPKGLLDDPAAYGLDAGAEVPGFKRPDDL